MQELQKRLEEEAKVEGQQFAGNQVLGLALGRALSRYGVRDWVEDAVVLEEWTQDSTPQVGGDEGVSGCHDLSRLPAIDTAATREAFDGGSNNATLFPLCARSWGGLRLRWTPSALSMPRT